MSKFLITLFLLASFSCSPTTVNRKANPTDFTANVGTATSYDVREKTQRVLDRYLYEIIRFEQTYDQIFFETEWRVREPFEDEYEEGIVEAITRITVNATPRTRASLTGSDLHVVRVYAENQVRYEGGDEWVRVPMSNMLFSYLNKFAGDLELELKTGMRQF